MDKTEYERIAEKYLDMVYKIALSHTGKDTDAEDVVQQTFYRLLVKKGGFSDEEHIKRWLIRVCVNESNSLFSGFWRKNVRFFSGGLDQPTDSDDSGRGGNEDPIFEMQESKALYEAVQKLPSKCRIVIYLFYYEGYKTQEIAQILQVRESTVRTRLVRGRKMLKEELKEAWDYE